MAGWLSTLAKVGGAAASAYGGKGGGVPKAGGGTDWGSLIGTGLSAAGDMSAVAGAQAGARAKGRLDESAALNSRDQTALEKYQLQQAAQNAAASTDLQRKSFSQTARMTAAQQAAMGDMFANYQPTQIDVPGIQSAHISGGLQMTPGSREAMSNLHKQALLAQLNPEAFKGGEMMTAPTLSAAPQAGKMDSFLGTLGTAGSLAGALGPTMAELMAKKDYSAAGPPQGIGVQTLAGLPGSDVGQPETPDALGVTYNPKIRPRFI